MSFDTELPDWLPPILVVEVKRLHDEVAASNDTAKAIDRLRRLACDARMKHVWLELYKKKREAHRPTDKYLHPATFFWRSRAQWNRLQASKLRQEASKLLKQAPRAPKGRDDENLQAERKDYLAKVLEGAFKNDENFEAERKNHQAQFLENGATFFEQQKDPVEPRWSEQDLAVRRFFYGVYHYFDLHIQPISRQEAVERLVEGVTTAERLRTEAEKLRSSGMDEETVLDLERLANECEEEAYWDEPDEDDPWLVERHSAEDELRAFIALLSQTTRQLFGGRSLYGVLARVANVAFSRSDVTPLKVREFLRGRDPGV